jgi:DNA helicase-2/ATP-dependent DNA helicase PcrA
MKKVVSDLEEDDFNDQERDFIQERFYLSLFDEVTLSEVFQYFRYGEEKTKYITMHKTKGSGIENVLVVLDEYFWNDYDFKSVYQSPENAKQRRKRLKNLKLVYVACSRAKKNLVCIKLIEPDEEEKLIKLFHGASIEKIPLEQLASH